MHPGPGLEIVLSLEFLPGCLFLETTLLWGADLWVAKVDLCVVLEYSICGVLRCKCTWMVVRADWWLTSLTRPVLVWFPRLT